MSKSIIAEYKDITEAEHRNIEDHTSDRKTLPPFRQQFTVKLYASVFSVIIALLFISILFWQQNQQAQSIIQTQLLPLQQQQDELISLQQAKLIVEELLDGDSEKNWFKLHTDLIVLNRQLLTLDSSHTGMYQKWLNQNKIAKNAVDRAENNKYRNNQLKQSSVVQLQLMNSLFISIIDEKNNHEKSLYQQLQDDKSHDMVTLNRASAYARAIKQAKNVNQIKVLLTKLLVDFEDLNIRTSQANFDSMRLSVKQLFAQTKLLQDDKTKAVVEFVQQTKLFANMMNNEQMILAKWQGYLRLMQDYNVDLLAQKKQISSLLSQPQTTFLSNQNDRLSRLLIRYNIHLTANEITLMILFIIASSLITFLILLGNIYYQIKTSSQKSLALIEHSLQGNDVAANDVNCYETQTVLQQIKVLIKPEQTEKNHQDLVNEIQLNKVLIEEQKQSIAELSEHLALQHKKQTGELDVSVMAGIPAESFSLLATLAHPNNSDYFTIDNFTQWHDDQLTVTNTFTDFETYLSRWLKEVITPSLESYAVEKTLIEKCDVNINNELILDDKELDELLAINEVDACLIADVNSETAFDFNRYLKHQGSVELALFMLEDYSQDNHQQLTFLATAIKDKDIYKAKVAVKNLQFNAQVLVAADLQQICLQWVELLSNDKKLSQLKQINVLLKDTQQVLHAIDSYAQTI